MSILVAGKIHLACRVVKGYTIILSTYFLDEVEGVCSQVIILNRGEVIAEGSITDIKRRAAPRTVVVFQARRETNQPERGVDEHTPKGSCPARRCGAGLGCSSGRTPEAASARPVGFSCPPHPRALPGLFSGHVPPELRAVVRLDAAQRAWNGAQEARKSLADGARRSPLQDSGRPLRLPSFRTRN